MTLTILPGLCSQYPASHIAVIELVQDLQQAILFSICNTVIGDVKCPVSRAGVG